jgi:hypothetical protein
MYWLSGRSIIRVLHSLNAPWGLLTTTYLSILRQHIAANSGGLV